MTLDMRCVLLLIWLLDSKNQNFLSEKPLEKLFSLVEAVNLVGTQSSSQMDLTRLMHNLINKQRIRYPIDIEQYKKW